MKQEQSKKETREQAENIVKNGPSQLEHVKKQLSLSRRKREIIDKKYQATEHYLDSANLEFQKDPEFISITKEEKLLDMDGEIQKLENQVEQIEKVISEAKTTIKENRG